MACGIETSEDTILESVDLLAGSWVAFIDARTQEGGIKNLPFVIGRVGISLCSL